MFESQQSMGFEPYPSKIKISILGGIELETKAKRETPMKCGYLKQEVRNTDPSQ